MSINIRVWGRKLHRWGAVLVAVPFLLVLITGLLLQVKKDVAWVQPPTKKGETREPAISFDSILAAVKAVPQAEVRSWDDVDRVDVRPKDGIAKVTCKNRYEVQIDFRTGEVVQVAYRRSDLIESLHDGSFFADDVKLYVFLPMAVVILGLWLTGMYLWVLPHSVKYWRSRAQKQAASPRAVAMADRRPGS
jgi:uncharacterized iron-regulated membrane protein